MGKHSLASLYYGKAIQANEEEAGRAPISASPLCMRAYLLPLPVPLPATAPLRCHGRRANSQNNSRRAAGKSRQPLKTEVADRIYELLYNQGLNYLFLGEEIRALQCFKATLLLFNQNPRLWYRMAECCVQHQAKQEDKVRADLIGSFVKVGSAQNTKTVIRAGTSRRQAGEGDLDPLSLRTAIVYLNNALALLTRASSKATESATTSPPGSPAPTVGGDGTAFALPGTFLSPVQEGDIAALRCHILAGLAYSHLGSFNSIEALRYSGELLAVADCPGHLKFLGHMYVLQPPAHPTHHATPDCFQHSVGIIPRS
jgi:CCR4-NOT transcription complex subunit 10